MRGVPRQGEQKARECVGAKEGRRDKGGSAGWEEPWGGSEPEPWGGSEPLLACHKRSPAGPN